MSVPVEPRVTPAASLPLWIMAAALSAVAIRYTFFPPCCEKVVPTTAMSIRALAYCDSVRPIPDGDNTCDVESTSMLLRGGTLIVGGTRPDTISIPKGGAVRFILPR
jgi:hypothetical protein